MTLTLGAGHFLVPNDSGPHQIGGPNSWKGAECPNCRKSLMLHATLDISDPALAGIGFPWKQLPLIYCCRCVIHYYPFSYRVIAEDTIKLIEYTEEDSRDLQEEWRKYSNLGDEFPQKSASLVPMPARLQEIINEANKSLKITEELEIEFGRLTEGYTKKLRNSRIRPLNQILGYGIIRQGPFTIRCSVCSGGNTYEASFLASLYNDETHGLQFSAEGLEILFYICSKCWTIDVIQVL